MLQCTSVVSEQPAPATNDNASSLRLVGANIRNIRRTEKHEMTSLKCGTHSKHGGKVVDLEGGQIHGERARSEENKTGGEERIKGTKSSGGAACEKMGMSEGIRMFSGIGLSLRSNAQDTCLYGGVFPICTFVCV